MAQAALGSLGDGTKMAVKSFQKVSSAALLGKNLPGRKERGFGVGSAHAGNPKHLVPPLGELVADALIQCNIHSKYRGV